MISRSYSDTLLTRPRDAPVPKTSKSEQLSRDGEQLTLRLSGFMVGGVECPIKLLVFMNIFLVRPAPLVKQLWTYVDLLLKPAKGSHKEID